MTSLSDPKIKGSRGILSGIWAPNNQLTSFVYDDGGRLVEKWFPNGVNTQYSYNPDNTLAQLINRHGTDLIISQHEYTYDCVGNRQTHNELIAGALNPYTYAYDGLNRLTTVTNTGTGAVESYAYDPLGNRRTRTSGGTTLAYVHDNANQLLEIHSGSTGGPLTAGLVYDNNGNLQKKCEGGTVTVSPTTCTGTTVTNITNDSLNRPVQITKTGIAAQSYKYDDTGRRIQKINGSTIINYLYNGSQILDQYDNTWGQPTFNYVYGPGADAPTIRASSTATQFYHQNGIGNVVAVSNQSGVTDGTAAYDVYGNLTTSTGTIPTYGFTGREPDETGFVYFRARYYDPTVGRFVQRDPTGFNGGVNMYTYVRNNPVMLADPLGLRALTSGEIGILAPIFNQPNAGFYGSIDVQNGANWNPIAAVALYVQGRPAITIGNTIYVNPNSNYLGAPAYQQDYAAPSTLVASQGLLVHETTHVFQNQTNGFLPTAAGSIYDNVTKGVAAYEYQISLQPEASGVVPSGPVRGLQDYGVEQQAALVEDYFYITRGVPPQRATNVSDFSSANSDPYKAIYEQTIGSAVLGPGASLGTTSSGSASGIQSLQSIENVGMVGQPSK